jgi:hypothetical protein
MNVRALAGGPLQTSGDAGERAAARQRAVRQDIQRKSVKAGGVAIGADGDLFHLRRQAAKQMRDQRLAVQLDKRLIQAAEAATPAARKDQGTHHEGGRFRICPGESYGGDLGGCEAHATGSSARSNKRSGLLAVSIGAEEIAVRRPPGRILTLGRTTGIEPATTGTTNRRSTN